MTGAGGTAFPLFSSDSVWAEKNLGMTLRDYFAAKALVGLMSASECGQSYSIEDCPKIAFDLADAMLKARRAKP